MSSSPTRAITDSSFIYDPAKTITRTTMEAAFPTVTHHYAQPYPTGDQIRERGKNHSAVTEGETFSDLWMDDLIMRLPSMPVTTFVPTVTLMGMS
jgi:hypothetical protein